MSESTERKKFYKRSLPHILPNDRPYFVTFRLAGSLPREVEREYALVRARREKRPFREIDRHLDKAHGPIWLRNPKVAEAVKEVLHSYDNEAYDLLAYSIMPNHVHMVIRLSSETDLYKTLKRIKGATAHKANTLLKRRGRFWQHESYDHVVRKQELGKVIYYVLLNPVKANLCERVKDWPYTYISPELDGFDDV